MAQGEILLEDGALAPVRVQLLDDPQDRPPITRLEAAKGARHRQIKLLAQGSPLFLEKKARAAQTHHVEDEEPHVLGDEGGPSLGVGIVWPRQLGAQDQIRMGLKEGHGDEVRHPVGGKGANITPPGQGQHAVARAKDADIEAVDLLLHPEGPGELLGQTLFKTEDAADARIAGDEAASPGQGPLGLTTKVVGEAQVALGVIFLPAGLVTFQGLGEWVRGDRHGLERRGWCWLVSTGNPSRPKAYTMGPPPWRSQFPRQVLQCPPEPWPAARGDTPP